jgi:dihydrodipicolinate synthase/N-acetylneuraminate lyase
VVVVPPTPTLVGGADGVVGVVGVPMPLNVGEMVRLIVQPGLEQAEALDIAAKTGIESTVSAPIPSSARSVCRRIS